MAVSDKLDGGGGLGFLGGIAEAERNHEMQSEYLVYRLTFKLRSSRAATIQPRLRSKRTYT